MLLVNSICNNLKQNKLTFISRNRVCSRESRELFKNLKHISADSPDFYTGDPMKPVSLDHLIPYSFFEGDKGKNISNRMGNLAPAKKSVNKKRGCLPIADFIQSGVGSSKGILTPKEVVANMAQGIQNCEECRPGWGRGVQQTVLTEMQSLPDDLKPLQLDIMRALY